MSVLVVVPAALLYFDATSSLFSSALSLKCHLFFAHTKRRFLTFPLLPRRFIVEAYVDMRQQDKEENSDAGNGEQGDQAAMTARALLTALGTLLDPSESRVALALARAGSALRFPAFAGAVVTFAIWNFVLVPMLALMVQELALSAWRTRLQRCRLEGVCRTKLDRGNWTVRTECAPGYTGAMCAGCRDGFGKAGGFCVTCPGAAVMGAISMTRD